MEKLVSLSDSGTVGNAELLIMTIEIGDGRRGRITIHEKDEPESLARAFSAEHSLPEALEKNLVSLIRQNKERAELRTFGTSPDLHTSSLSSKVKSNRSSSRVLSASKSSKPRRNTSMPQLNYGELLHKKGQSLRESQQKYIAECQAQVEVKIAAELCPFKPMINEYSNLLSPRYFEKTEDLLFRKKEEKTQRLEKQRQMSLEKEMKECTFSPKLGQKTRRLAKNKSVPKHEALHLDALERKLKRELASETTFKMNFSLSSSKKMTFEEQEKHADDLIRFKGEKDARRAKATVEAEEKEMFDNGNPLFRPQTGKKPALNRQGNIHDHLYGLRNDKKARSTKRSQDAIGRAKNTANKPKMSEQSLKIFEQFRGKQYARLFTLMDSDNDGLISADLISIEGLSTQNLMILTPLFDLLDQGNVLDIEGFINVIEQIWDRLTVEQRAELLKRDEKTKVEVEERTTMNAKSSALAQQRNSLLSEDLYERFKHSQQLAEMRNKKVQEIYQNAEMKECTFSPKIKKISKRS